MSRKFINKDIDPDEIFSDSLNIPGFDEEQFEGRLERPIQKYVIFLLGFFFLAVGVIFGWRTWVLQVARGDDYAILSERNHLRNIPIFAERGIIYDRNHLELAWNAENKDMGFSARAYIPEDGLAHVLGYVSMPKLDQSGKFWQTESIGKDGVEKFYNEVLRGKNGTKVIETDVAGKTQSENVILPPEQGNNLTLTIDARVTKKMYQSIADLARAAGFSGGAGIIMDVRTGEIIALTSFPEYSPAKLVSGKDSASIQAYLDSKRTPFLNRAVSGLYAPGSTVKPFVAIGALSEGVIDPLKQILSTGSISIPNPYDSSKSSVFKDWRAHGWVDMRQALAVSSDVYFYEIGGGYQGQKGLGIANIKKYAQMFGLDKMTGIDLPSESEGIIPDPEWKAKNFNGEKWFVGNTYHTAIGQYGFQVTPLQLVRAVAAIANDGILVTPHVGARMEVPEPRTILLDKKFFSIVKEGMRLGVTEGISMGLNISGVSVAAKTGTAEIGASRSLVNSWITGFFPYDNPKYAFVVVMERAPHTNTLGSVHAMRPVLEWMVENTPEYLK